MSIVNVKQISHIALKTRAIEQQIDFYTHMVGLGETERDSAGRAYLRWPRLPALRREPSRGRPHTLQRDGNRPLCAGRRRHGSIGSSGCCAVPRGYRL